ncbi:YdeI/OmpD-associated family protein [Belliella aquatica]|uniref:YdhG-like domain-containing protein n=1 Tax=Belliella aquatica TaxID=1323734 RepID=A0ABQ1MFC9_9BACT|nr:DUF1801 domain-containing protein [Belliella aquatica]MCH7405122.1 YdeI/OmpD-associated family protein [Belliella aquatica]GGC39587.1 hypothetical protein GCM10010993_17940 [Belliella aquatica]
MQKDKTWVKELQLLNEIIQKTPLKHSIKWGIDVYTFAGHNVIGICGFKNYFGIWFYNGVFLKDPKNVFINAQEGKTKALRQWRLNSIEEIDELTLIAYIEEAIENEKQGKRWVAEKIDNVVVAGTLADALSENHDLETAFNKLSLSKQKEYVDYISEAKREATQITRLDKIKPLIIAGKGLNDQYKK